MRRKLNLAAAIVSVLFVSIVLASDNKKEEEATPPDGKAIFKSAKCGSCHYVSKFDLGKKPSDGKANKAPDLSTVGSKYTAEFLIKYLKKAETIEGKKHMGTFKGSDADFVTLVKWLESLKKEEQAPPRK